MADSLSARGKGLNCATPKVNDVQYLLRSVLHDYSY